MNAWDKLPLSSVITYIILFKINIPNHEYTFGSLLDDINEGFLVKFNSKESNSKTCYNYSKINKLDSIMI